MINTLSKVRVFAIQGSMQYVADKINMWQTEHIHESIVSVKMTSTHSRNGFGDEYDNVLCIIMYKEEGTKVAKVNYKERKDEH